MYARAFNAIMTHRTLPDFWKCYRNLPKEIQELARKNYQLLKVNLHHPSLQSKKTGRSRHLWSVRVGEENRASALNKPESVIWFWIGSHEEYNKLIRQL